MTNTTAIRNSEIRRSLVLESRVSLRTGPSYCRRPGCGNSSITTEGSLAYLPDCSLGGVSGARVSGAKSLSGLKIVGDINNMFARRAQAFFAPAVLVRQYPLPAIYAFEVYHGLTSRRIFTAVDRTSHLQEVYFTRFFFVFSACSAVNQ